MQTLPFYLFENVHPLWGCWFTSSCIVLVLRSRWRRMLSVRGDHVRKTVRQQTVPALCSGRCYQTLASTRIFNKQRLPLLQTALTTTCICIIINNCIVLSIEHVYFFFVFYEVDKETMDHRIADCSWSSALLIALLNIVSRMNILCKSHAYCSSILHFFRKRLQLHKILVELVALGDQSYGIFCTFLDFVSVCFSGQGICEARLSSWVCHLLYPHMVSMTLVVQCCLFLDLCHLLL